LILALVVGYGCSSSGRGHDAADLAHTSQAASTVPAWQPGKLYTIGTLVTFNDIVYECRQTHTSQTGWEPPNTPALWQRPTPSGTTPWATQTHYIVGSQVTYQGSLFKCLQEHVSQIDWVPTATPALWTKLATVTVVIDTTITPTDPSLPGLSGGPARAIGAVAGPGLPPEEVALDELIFRPTSDAELQAFLTKWGGVVVRSGVSGGPPPGADAGAGGPVDDNGLGYLIRIDPSLAPLSQLASTLVGHGEQGTIRFSSERTARLIAIALEEPHATPNLVLDTDSIPEHPDDSGGNIDSSTFPEYTDDDDPSTPGDQGLSTSVVRAWDYLAYKGFPPPPPGGTFQPPVLAIIDCGFDFNPVTGEPNGGNIDYFLPKQVDLVDADGKVGNNKCRRGFPWHGQGTFSVAAARQGNSFGSAGTGGPVAIPMLMRTDLTHYNVADGIRSATLRGASVINMSLSGSCNWFCRVFTSQREHVQNAALFAVNNGVVVVSSAGNDGKDLTGSLRIPCTSAGTICVGSVSSTKNNVFNFGAPVDISAPTNILATPNPISSAGDANDIGIDELFRFGGTSASAPFISGVVALMKTVNPAIEQAQVLSILQSTANPSPDPRVPRGYVDALRAVQAVSPNVPPTISIVSPVEGTQLSPGFGVSLQAKVEDPDSKLAFAGTVQWTDDIAGPLCQGISCSGPALGIGAHTITAVVTDPFGATATASVHVQVVNTAPSPTITQPAGGSTFFAGQLITFLGFANDPDESLPDSALAWASSIDGSIGTGRGFVTALSPGVHVISLTATDSFGTSQSTAIALTVNAESGHPSAQILAPGNGALVGPPGAPVTLVGLGTDPEDGTLPDANLSWSSDIDGFLGTGSSLTVVLSGPGTPCHPETLFHVITLTVTDSDGHTATVSITVGVGIIC